MLTTSHKYRAFLLVLWLGLSSWSAFAQWQWLDKDGRKVFSDRGPPPEVPDKNILKRPGAVLKKDAEATAQPGMDKEPAPPPATAAAPEPKVKTSGTDKELAAKKQQATDAAAAKKKSEEEQLAKNQVENCARAKQSKAELSSGSRMTRMGANGEREYLDDAAKASELTRVQSIIQRDCK